jgi:hypothetical protein
MCVHQDAIDFLQLLNVDLDNGYYDIMEVAAQCDLWIRFIDSRVLHCVAYYLVKRFHFIKNSSYTHKQIWELINEYGCETGKCTRIVIMGLLQYVSIDDFNKYIGLDQDFPYDVDETNTTRLSAILLDNFRYLNRFLDSPLMKDQSLKWMIYNLVVNFDSLHLRHILTRSGKSHPMFSWDEITEKQMCIAIHRWSQVETIEDAENIDDTVELMIKCGFPEDRLTSLYLIVQAHDRNGMSRLFDFWRESDREYGNTGSTSDMEDST